MATCKGCKKEAGDYMENGYCYSCRRRHFEKERQPVLFDFLDESGKKKLIG